MLDSVQQNAWNRRGGDVIRTFIIYRLIDRCLDNLFDRWTGLFVDPNEVVNSIQVGKFYHEMYSIFWAESESVRVENWFGSVTVVAKTSQYIEVRCNHLHQVYTFDTHENAMRYTGGRSDIMYNHVGLFSYSKGTVEKINQPDFFRHIQVIDNEVHVLCYMKMAVDIPLNITVKPEGIRSITP